MPLAISRVALFAGDDWGTTILFVGASLYACGGLCNALLYTATRRGLITWSWCGWRQKLPKAIHFGGRNPTSPTIPGEKTASQDSTGSEVIASPRGARISDSILDFGGVDFSNATGFDKVNPTEDDKRGA
jgi:hypothetical protein